MSETNIPNQNEKAAKIRRKPEQESALSPTFAAIRQESSNIRQQSQQSGNSLLQRQCGCGKHTIAGGVCEECQKKGESISRASPDEMVETNSPAIQTFPDRPRRPDFSAIPARTIPASSKQIIQPSLTVNEPGDPYEQEANQAADVVMRMPASPLPPPLNGINNFLNPTVSRWPSISHIQTNGSSGTFQAPAHVEARISQMQGGGQTMPDSERDFFETRMGYDFSRVRVHTDANAVQASRNIQARAFTIGNNIAFNQGAYQPGTEAGRRLLAHELTHVAQQGSGKVQPKFEGLRSIKNPSLKSPTVPQIQREDEVNKLDRLNEMLDSFNVPEGEVITLCGQLGASEKATVLAGGYRRRMASALNVGEMVRAVNNLGPVLSTKLEWVNDAALMTSSIDYADIGDMVRSAPQSERDALKINFWKNFFVGVCDNETMITALNNLGFDLVTKLQWLQAEMTVTSAELNYATIRPWITDPAADRNVLKTNVWRDFFVAVCDNQTMITALNDLGFDLVTKLQWLQAEMTVTSAELNYATIKPWVSDPAADRNVLKTNVWRDFFVDVCDNETMIEALNDLNFDMETQVRWMIEESDKATVLATNTFMARVRTAPNFAALMKILVDVSALPVGKIQDAVAELAGSELEIDRNTANQIIEGNVTAYYIEDLLQPPDVNAVITAAGLDPAAFTVYLEPPINTERLFVQQNANGFTNMDSTKIFSLRSDSIASWKATLAHETNHAVNRDAEHPGASFERYKGEFRAYWVANYRNVADLDVRAQQVKAHILGGYPLLSNRYNNDAAFQAQVDGHTRPEGNVTND